MKPPHWLVVFSLLGAVALAGEGRAPDARVLKVCVVDAAKSHDLDESFQRAFTLRVFDSLRQDGAGGCEVENVGAREAAKRLKAGACAAVVVIGADRPAPLRGLDAVAIAGTLGWQRNCTPVYLIVPAGEPARHEKLAEGFRAAVAAETRRVALARE